jgi:hypothetical protein
MQSKLKFVDKNRTFLGMFSSWLRIQMHLLTTQHQDMSYNYKCRIMYGQPSKQGASQPVHHAGWMDEKWMDGWMNG